MLTIHAELVTVMIKDKYESESVASVPVGVNVGEFVCAKNGYKYNGEFLGDKMTGYGVWHVSGGDRYEGQWLNGMKHGYGTYYYFDGSVYQGQYDFHKAQGKARLTRGYDVRDYIWVDNNETSSTCDMTNILPHVTDGWLCLIFSKNMAALEIELYIISSNLS